MNYEAQATKSKHAAECIWHTLEFLRNREVQAKVIADYFQTGLPM